MPTLAVLLLAAVTPCPVGGIPSGPVESGATFLLQFDAPPVPTRYIIATSRAGDARQAEAALVEPGPQQSTVIRLPRTPEAADFEIRIFGTAGDESVVCSSKFMLHAEPSPATKSVADRMVVPVVGKLPGQYGSSWRTSLQLIGYGTGTIYFRRGGAFFGDDRDPHLTYDLGPILIAGIPGVIQIDDIMAELGVTGIGSLDIVPDFIDEGSPPYRQGYLAPRAEARIVNVTDSGTVGGIVRASGPEILSKGELRIVIPPGYGKSARVNVGLRTFDRPAKLRVGVYIRESDALGIVKEIEIPGNVFRQMAIEEVVPHDVWSLRPGDFLILIEDGYDAAFAGYYSVTDNQTNDTEVFTEPAQWDYPRLREIAIPARSD